MAFWQSHRIRVTGSAIQRVSEPCRRGGMIRALLFLGPGEIVTGHLLFVANICFAIRECGAVPGFAFQGRDGAEFTETIRCGLDPGELAKFTENEQGVTGQPDLDMAVAPIAPFAFAGL